MRFLLVFLTFLTFPLVSESHAAAPVLEARSVADHCRFIYRIETDFKIYVAEASEVTYWLHDLYTDEDFEPTTQVADESPLAMTLVSMSTNPRYLTHELFFTVDDDPQIYKVNFSRLMNRCFDSTERDILPYTELSVEEVSAVSYQR